MKIKDILDKTNPSFSFEFFPPKDDKGFSQLFSTIEKLSPCSPSYISVTYGAGGSTRSKTIDLVGRIKHEIGLESMAHLTCVGSPADEIQEILQSLKDKGIENILALRGDPPKGEKYFEKPKNGFGFANELVHFIKQSFDFCIGVAGYPEGHVECFNKEKDLDNLKMKVDAGADFIVTQLFFDNKYYFDFVEKLQSKGINIPVIAGIMPILNFKQILRFTEMCGSSIPKDLMGRLDQAKDDVEQVKSIGIEHSTQQCRNLIEQGAPGIHFYTLNKSVATLNIMKTLNGSGSL